ncbi:MAG: S8 family peptidase [Gammaproteobacteria bacterium]|nr:S8 family peptidase [Gammaproteobacteria bacterium]
MINGINRKTKKPTTTLLLLLFGLLAFTLGPVLAAPIYGLNHSKRINGQFIVVLKENQSAFSATKNAIAIDIASTYSASVSHRYAKVLRGFVVNMPEGRLQALAKDPRVAFIEADRIIRLSATQSNATWGIDRTDQRDLPLDQLYTYNTDASNVNVYVIDTGIRQSHANFAGRAISGFSAINDRIGTNDCNGHGTHVAGTIGSATYGIAKQVTLHAVRVLDCQGAGSLSGVIAGIDWVTSNHVTPAVANLSLGGGASRALDNAVRNSIAAGVTYVVAAGNDNIDACSQSPSRVDEALTVAASTATDRRSSFSNWGACIDVFAPGSSITSTWHSSDSAVNTISGTSMASPMVAGVAALYLADNPNASPSEVVAAVISSASNGRISNIGTGSPNRLVYAPLTSENTDSGTITTCPAGSETFAGSLSGTGAVEYQPDGTYYYSASSGLHIGNLEGPTLTDFDLYLWKWNSRTGWQTVASSTNNASSESVNYSGTRGYYVWRVHSYRSGGNYNFCMTRP